MARCSIEVTDEETARRELTALLMQRLAEAANGGVTPQSFMQIAEDRMQSAQTE